MRSIPGLGLATLFSVLLFVPACGEEEEANPLAPESAMRTEAFQVFARNVALGQLVLYLEDDVEDGRKSLSMTDDVRRAVLDLARSAPDSSGLERLGPGTWTERERAQARAELDAAQAYLAKMQSLLEPYRDEIEERLGGKRAWVRFFPRERAPGEAEEE